jgi:hypothetical protein
MQRILSRKGNMADVGKVPTVPPPPSRDGQEVSKPSSKQFKDVMKVDKSDEEQKRRKKQQTESEEEAKALLRAGANAREKVEGTKKPEKFPKIQKVGESEKRQKHEQKRPEETEHVQETALTSAPSSQQLPPAPVEKTASQKGLTRPPIENPAVEEEIAAQETKAEEEEKVALQPFKKETPNKETPQPFVAPPSSPLGPLFIAPAPASAPAYTLLKPEALALFERMVSQIMVMQTSGITETTLTLNTPEFASSMFAGSQIIIREFSTAPLAYNIEFVGTDQNVPIFDRNIESLRSAFASERRSFTINRIESSRLRTEKRPLFHRKKGPSDEGTES